MRLGIAAQLSHSTPEEWAAKHAALGLRSVVFPCSYTDDQSKIDAYVDACRQYDLRIAEVGSWCNPMASDAVQREANISRCIHQLELAEYIQADCCVNIAGAAGEVWDGPYRENFSRQTYEQILDTTCRIIDAVNPKHTVYSLEPMPWMVPYSAQNYLDLIKDVNREGFGVHMDMINMINSPEKCLFSAEYTNEAFALLGPYIKSCHIKDVALSTKLTTLLKEVPCGEGNFDLKNYIAQIDKLSPEMPVIIEHLDQVDLYLNAIDYIKELISK